jgi:TldD protein
MAREEAKNIKGEKIKLYKVPVVNEKIVFETFEDPRKVSLEEKKEICEKYNRIILSNPLIQSSVLRYREIFTKKYFINSEGTKIYQEKSDVALTASAIAKEGMNIQQAHFSIGGISGFQILRNLENEIERITKNAIEMLKAEPVPSGKYTVICDPELTGLFAHEAFGHMSEGDFLYENPDIQKMMKIGKRFGPEFLNIVDDGTIFGEQGTSFYDDEGVKTKKTYLIKNGILKSRLHNRETAEKMQEEPTGNARAINFRFPPIVRMTNTFIEPSSFSFQNILEETEFGIYARGSRGGQTNCELFTFSPAEAYLIEKGKIKKRLRDVVLSGNIFETLNKIDAICDDLKLFGGTGGCGKGEQVPLPITLGGPHIRIKEIIVGGK